MKNLATFAQAEKFYTMLNPTDEPDVRIRNAVWEDLQQLLLNGSVKEIKFWPDRFKNDPPRRLEALKAKWSAIQEDRVAMAGYGFELFFLPAEVGETVNGFGYGFKCHHRTAHGQKSKPRREFVEKEMRPERCGVSIC